MKSLREYAEEEGKLHKCYGCSLPKEIQKEVEEGATARIPIRIIVGWLHKEGFSAATTSKIERHVREHVQ